MSKIINAIQDIGCRGVGFAVGAKAYKTMKDNDVNTFISAGTGCILADTVTIGLEFCCELVKHGYLKLTTKNETNVVSSEDDEIVDTKCSELDEGIHEFEDLHQEHHVEDGEAIIDRIRNEDEDAEGIETSSSTTLEEAIESLENLDSTGAEPVETEGVESSDNDVIE